MATITPAAVFPVTGAASTSPAYSGTFIPTVWSSKLNAKFYNASTFAACANTDWEGDIKNMGDKVIIRQVPDMVINDYTAGQTLTYGVPTPSTIELQVDQGKSFSFEVKDVLEWQSDIGLMNTFSNDASEQMRVAIDFAAWRDNFNGGAAANKGATAGVKSGAINLGTDAAPVTLTAANVLTTILNMATVLDEQNVPETGRYLVLDPLTRTLLFSSDLAKTYVTGDGTSPIRNGLVGKIDRFDVYVSNQLPRGAAGQSFPTKAAPTGTTQAGAVARRAILAGHKSAITFAAQMSKMETLRNPNDFGDLVRGLNVYGYKVVKPEALALLIAN